jgi:hypothetical protein
MQPCDADKVRIKGEGAPLRRNFLWSPIDVKKLPQEMKTISALNLCVPSSKGHTHQVLLLQRDGHEISSTRSSVKKRKELKDNHLTGLAGPDVRKEGPQNSHAHKDHQGGQQAQKMCPEQYGSMGGINAGNTGKDTDGKKDCPSSASGSSGVGKDTTQQGADSQWAGVEYEQNHLERFFSNQLAIGRKW